MRFTQFRRGFHCSLQNFIYFCLRNFATFRGYYIYLLTQLSIFDAVQNPEQIRQTEKILIVENFSATTITQAPVQTKNMIEKYSCFFWFFQKKLRRWLFSWDYFFAESAKWSLMNGRFQRWKNILRKLNSRELLEKIGTTSGLKDKNLPKLCKMTTIFTEFCEVFDLSDLSKNGITETSVISDDSLSPKLTIIYTVFTE